MKDIELIARWFINNINPDPLKLQKLLYFSQGISFCMFEEELFPEEFEAWVNGPVIPEIYFKYKEFGFNPILTKFDEPKLEDKVLEVLNYVKRTYGKYDGKYLKEITHNQEPWLYARRGLDPDERDCKTIPKEIIAEYFSSIMNQPMIEEWS